MGRDVDRQVFLFRHLTMSSNPRFRLMAAGWITGVILAVLNVQLPNALGAPTVFQPTSESLKQHQVPAWFHDAKLGIFIHWGVYSVPGWAPPTGNLPEVVAKEGWSGWFTRNPYAEWYFNSYQIENSPTWQHHREVYGEPFRYDDFVPLFNSAIEKWNPNEWADLFQKVGARYVVMTTKHHDGFLLWPSAIPNPQKTNYFARRDLVGELTTAVRARGLRMGLYYSGGLDWTFKHQPITNIWGALLGTPGTPAYADYAMGQWRELIRRYQPQLLWNDLGSPPSANLKELMAEYYNQIPEGVVNDRFRLSLLPGVVGEHYDFKTPEYATLATNSPVKWESTRGLGYSFGFNRNEKPEHLLSVEALVGMFVDVVSKNGNLLLNIGPMADGTIPEEQRKRLLGLGQWLETNGEAIFGTRPGLVSEYRATGGVNMRFTQRSNTLYAILLQKPTQAKVTIPHIQLPSDGQVTLLGHPAPLTWRQNDADLTIDLPETMASSPAYTLKIKPWSEAQKRK